MEKFREKEINPPTLRGLLRVRSKVTGRVFESEISIVADGRAKGVILTEVDSNKILSVEIASPCEERGRIRPAVIITDNSGRKVLHNLGRRVSRKRGREYFSLTGAPFDLFGQRICKTDYQVIIEKPCLGWGNLFYLQLDRDMNEERVLS